MKGSITFVISVGTRYLLWVGGQICSNLNRNPLADCGFPREYARLCHVLPSAGDGQSVVTLLMGVSGSGKTTVGHLLARQLGWDFADADDYHSAANVEKMRRGIPLSDDDRAAWLQTLRDLVAGWVAAGKNGVLACSALKRTYQETLRVGPEVQIVYLKGTRVLLRQRLRARVGHFMTEKLLDSQLATLEDPEHAVVVDIDRASEEVVADIRARLALTKTT
jgi:gluconokinase